MSSHGETNREINRLVKEAKVDCDCGCVESAIDRLAAIARHELREKHYLMGD